MATIPLPPEGFEVLVKGQPLIGLATIPYTQPREAGVSPVGVAVFGRTSLG
jgi:hypothetical protein